MKKENFISKMKTAGVVAAAVVSMNSCEQKNTADDVFQAAEYKTDSAANIRPEYKNTANAIMLYQAQIETYKDANKNMLRYYAEDHINRTVKNARIRKFLLAAMEEQLLVEVSGLDADEFLYRSADLDSCDVTQMRFYRRNQRWYNDLVLYLADKYNERQLLNGDFFKTIENTELKKTFEYNTKQIERLKSISKVALKRENAIYEDLWRQYSSTKQRKR